MQPHRKAAAELPMPKTWKLIKFSIIHCLWAAAYPTSKQFHNTIKGGKGKTVCGIAAYYQEWCWGGMLRNYATIHQLYPLPPGDNPLRITRQNTRALLQKYTQPANDMYCEGVLPMGNWRKLTCRFAHAD